MLRASSSVGVREHQRSSPNITRQFKVYCGNSISHLFTPFLIFTSKGLRTKFTREKKIAALKKKKTQLDDMRHNYKEEEGYKQPKN